VQWTWRTGALFLLAFLVAGAIALHRYQQRQEARERAASEQVERGDVVEIEIEP
jgi:hypothetical protein